MSFAAGQKSVVVPLSEEQTYQEASNVFFEILVEFRVKAIAVGNAIVRNSKIFSRRRHEDFLSTIPVRVEFGPSRIECYRSCCRKRRGKPQSPCRRSNSPLISTAMSESTISLNCYVLRDHSGNVFTVEIPRTKNVAILKDMIKEKKAHLLAHVDATDLDLFQVR